MAESRLLLPAERDEGLKSSKKNYFNSVSHVFDNLTIGEPEELNSGKNRHQQNYMIHDGSTARNLISYDFALPYRDQVQSYLQ